MELKKSSLLKPKSIPLTYNSNGKNYNTSDWNYFIECNFPDIISKLWKLHLAILPESDIYQALLSNYSLMF